jgi:lipoyl(octanoyl) transferase
VNPLRCGFLGCVPYEHATRLQGYLVDLVRRGETGDLLLLLTHPPVITLGRGAHADHVIIPDAERVARGIELHEAGRGGDVTYHGPGQLVGYPIVALREGRRDAHRYLRDLEEGLIATAAAFGVAASRIPGLTGIWFGDAKLGALGVRIGTGWISSHGFALNVGRDLLGFEAIVPCGIRDKSVTSLAIECDEDLAPENVAKPAATAVASALGYEAVWDDEALAALSLRALSSPPVPGGRA